MLKKTMTVGALALATGGGLALLPGAAQAENGCPAGQTPIPGQSAPYCQPIQTESINFRGLSVARIRSGNGGIISRATARLTLSKAGTVFLSFRRTDGNGETTTVFRTATADVGAGRRTVRFRFSKKLVQGDYTVVATAKINGETVKDRLDITISKRGTGVSTAN